MNPRNPAKVTVETASRGACTQEKGPGNPGSRLGDAASPETRLPSLRLHPLVIPTRHAALSPCRTSRTSALAAFPTGDRATLLRLRDTRVPLSLSLRPPPSDDEPVGRGRRGAQPLRSPQRFGRKPVTVTGPRPVTGKPPSLLRWVQKKYLLICTAGKPWTRHSETRNTTHEKRNTRHEIRTSKHETQVPKESRLFRDFVGGP
jgi:hypothetical protein